MNRIKQYEIKIMGLTFIVPIVVMAFIILLSIQFRYSNNVEYIICSTMENLIPLFAGWWGSYSLYELLEEEGGEVIFTYGISTYKLGIKRNLFYLIMYFSMIIVVSMIVMKITINQIILSMIIQLLFQALFYSGISFILMIILKNVGWVFFIQITYFVIGYFTKGKALFFLNIYLFQQDFNYSYNNLIDVCVRATIVAIVCYVVGHKLLNKNRN